MKKVQGLTMLSIAMLIFASVCLTGCPAGSGSYMKSQVQFDYPNSNVVPLGKVSATISSTSIMQPDISDPKLEMEVAQKALAQKNGDILIDATFHYKMHVIPLYIIYIYTTDLSVEGTACKMTVGKQVLH